ncbi:MAG: NgoFVII family restriction endonuclease, partial [Flavobacterium sp.]|nr:NgoFVII family restriction endonuclease [Flavobacterium sp.]
MFIGLQEKQKADKYYELLQIVGCLSNLFSESNVPYLYYRAAENIFCKAFEADNLSRSDCSVDARKNNLGIGLKTFLNNNGKTYQKIAEFNKDRKSYSNKSELEDFIVKISSLRNKRIESTRAIHGVNNVIYHCVAREENKLLIFEENMDLIDLEKIEIKSNKDNSVIFKDNGNEYNFNISKSTLFKRF